MKIATKFIGAMAAFVGLAALLTSPSSASAAEEKFPIATFSFPTISNIYADLIIANGFDKANGYKAEPIVYGTGAALWAGLAKGEIFVHNSSPFLFQKMVSDGVPLQLFGTLFEMGWRVITKNPAIKTFADLKGHTLTATVAFAEYDYLDIYARKVGISLKNNDITVIDATTALGQAQLEAGRADAILSWDPSATMIMKKNPDAHVILTGADAWKVVSGGQGCESCLVVRTDYLKDHPKSLMRLLKMYQEAAHFAVTNPDEADAIISSGKYSSKGIPAGIIATALKNKSLLLDVRPTWDPATNKEFWTMFQAGVETGKIPALPPKSSVIDKAPAN